jgi:hypothetical protein
MCDLCKLVEQATRGPEPAGKVYLADGLCVIIDSVGDKPGQDGFQPKVVIYRQHEAEPQPPIISAIMESVKRLFHKRNVWFPQTKDGKPYGLDLSKSPPEFFGDKMAVCEWPSHWYILVE